MCGDWHFPWFHSLLAIFSPLTTTTLSTHVHTRTDSELAEWKGEFICNLSFCFEASALCECAIFTICWMPLLRCCCSYIGVRNLFTLNVQREKVFWLLRMLCHVCCVSETPQASCAEAHQPANQLDIRITMVNGEKSAFRSSVYTFMHELMFAFALNIMKFICVSTCGICNNCLSWKRYVCSSVVGVGVTTRAVAVRISMPGIFPSNTRRRAPPIQSTPFSFRKPFSCKIWFFSFFILLAFFRSFIRNTNSKSNLNKPKVETFFKQHTNADLQFPLRHYGCRETYMNI